MKGTDYLEMPELISTEYKVYLDEIEKAKYEALRDKHMCYYDSVESVRQSRALSERNRPGLFS